MTWKLHVHVVWAGLELSVLLSQCHEWGIADMCHHAKSNSLQQVGQRNAEKPAHLCLPIQNKFHFLQLGRVRVRCCSPQLMNNRQQKDPGVTSTQVQVCPQIPRPHHDTLESGKGAVSFSFSVNLPAQTEGLWFQLALMIPQKALGTSIIL